MNTEVSSSDEEGKKSDDEVLPPQVVEYYQKYSQSRKLPAYFRGSTINRIEECLQSTVTESCDNSVTITEKDRGESPSSSVASKSKLEWDNGADIGYENVEVEAEKPESDSAESSGKNVCASAQSSVQKRIGAPMAESTPVIRQVALEYVETPILPKKGAKLKKKRSSSYEDLSSSRSEKTLKKWNSQQNLFDPERVLETKFVPLKKVINLRPTKATVIECLNTKSKRDKNTQTTLPRNATSAAVQTENEVGEVPLQPERVAVVYSQHSDLENPENRTESTTQTDSEGAVVSKCDSFEFLGNLRRTAAQTNLAPASGGGDDGSGGSSGESVGVTKQFSRDLIGDIDKTIGLIQKLANSKRYDEVTKRYYLKKIVEKIVNNCYSDDSGEKERYLQGNKPWRPVGEAEKPPLKTQTFVAEFAAETKRKSPFTLCQSRFESSPPAGHSTKNMPSSSGDAPDSSTTDDWRDQKTLSERLFEEEQRRKSTSSGDNVVSFAKQERQSQLMWINNEIEHLNRLKQMLENKRRNAITSAVLKPHVEDFPLRKKSTTVYMITTEKTEEEDATSSLDSRKTAPIPTCCSCVSPPAKTTPIDLKNARLVSNDVFTTNSANGRATTSVARYCFEIPIDKKNVILQSVNNVQIGSRRACKCCATQRGGSNRSSQTFLQPGTEAGMYASRESSNFEMQANVLQLDRDVETERFLSAKHSSASQHPETADRQLRTEAINRLAMASQTGTNQIGPCCATQKDAQVNCSCTQTSSRNSRTTACQCKCGKTAASCASSSQTHSKTHKSSAISTGFSVKAKSGGSSVKAVPSSPKDNTQKDFSESQFKPSTSSTTTFTSSTSSSSAEFRLCPCCRLNKVALPSERSVSNSQPAPNYILCHPCYQQCAQTTKPGCRPYYTYPGHVCNCYTVLKTSALNQIRQTVKDLASIDAQEDYCKCVLSKSSKRNKDVCELCGCKLRKVRTTRRGIAYTLTIESTPPKSASPKGVKNLPEIKIKVPDTRSHKHRKDKENEDLVKERSTKKRKSHAAPSMSLQEYLSMNRPGFVQSAEERRKCLLELALMREERCDKYKQLLALTSGAPQIEVVINDNGYKEKKLFTTKEMKAITAKHYKKLPEVQQKLIDNKERQIKFANRLLANIFNKKVRECALQGKTNLSTSYSVINFA